MNKPRPEPQVISFRLDSQHWERMCERAQALELSTHALARFYVTEALMASTQMADLGTALHELHVELQQLLSAVHQLHAELKGQRADLALGVQALLASAGKSTAKEAKAWVEQSLNRRPPCSPSPAP